MDKENISGKLKLYASVVSKMRKQQVLYFRTRDYNTLKECKTIERQVDKMTKDILEEDGQKTMF